MIIFHRFLIVTAILFCAGFSIWTIAAWRDGEGGRGTLALGVAFALAAIGFVVYLRNLKRFLRTP